MGWQTSVTNAENEALTYTYDLFGNVLTMTDAVTEVESYDQRDGALWSRKI